MQLIFWNWIFCSFLFLLWECQVCASVLDLHLFDFSDWVVSTDAPEMSFVIPAVEMQMQCVAPNIAPFGQIQSHQAEHPVAESCRQEQFLLYPYILHIIINPMMFTFCLYKLITFRCRCGRLDKLFMWIILIAVFAIIGLYVIILLLLYYNNNFSWVHSQTTEERQ